MIHSDSFNFAAMNLPMIKKQQTHTHTHIYTYIHTSYYIYIILGFMYNVIYIYMYHIIYIYMYIYGIYGETDTYSGKDPLYFGVHPS